MSKFPNQIIYMMQSQKHPVDGDLPPIYTPTPVKLQPRRHDTAENIS